MKCVVCVFPVRDCLVHRPPAPSGRLLCAGGGTRGGVSSIWKDREWVWVGPPETPDGPSAVPAGVRCLPRALGARAPPGEVPEGSGRRKAGLSSLVLGLGVAGMRGGGMAGRGECRSGAWQRGRPRRSRGDEGRAGALQRTSLPGAGPPLPRKRGKLVSNGRGRGGRRHGQ